MSLVNAIQTAVQSVATQIITKLEALIQKAGPTGTIPVSAVEQVLDEIKALFAPAGKR